MTVIFKMKKIILLQLCKPGLFHLLLSSPSVESKIHWLRSRLFKSRYLRGEYIKYTLLYFYIFLLYRIKLFTLNCIVYGCFSRLSVKTSSLARVFFIGSRSSQNKRERIVSPILLSALTYL